MAGSIRVLHLSMTKSVGGIASFQKNLFEHIDKDRIRFDFVTTYPKAAMTAKFEEMGAVVHLLPPQRTVIPYCISLYKLLKKEKYDIVHIHKNSCANPMAFFICKLAGVKTVIGHSHNTQSIGGGAVDLLHYIFRPLVRRCSDVKLACSGAAGEWLFGKKTFGKTEIIKNGIDTDLFSYNREVREEVRREFALEGKLTIGHVGNFIPQKNHKFMVDIFSELVKIHPESVMIFLGRGDSMGEIRNYAMQAGVSDKILFPGSRSDVHRFYQAMDVFLFPSLHEGLPIAGVEAQAAGLPCLFSDSVTDEIIICRNAKRIPLNQPAEVWAARIAELADGFVRGDTSNEVLSHGYDAHGTARRMQEIYLKGKAEKNAE